MLEEVRKSHGVEGIVVLTTYERDERAMRALKAGASGYFLKSAFRKELFDAIRTGHAGLRFLIAVAGQEIAVHAA